MATQADLVSRVLQDLYILEAGATPDATSAVTVNTAIAEVQAELQERRISYWPLSDIPEAVMRGLTMIVSGNVGRKFRPEMTVQECEGLREAGMRRIREVIAMQQDHQTVPQTYF
jgi:hypothetical protein